MHLRGAPLSSVPGLVALDLAMHDADAAAPSRAGPLTDNMPSNRSRLRSSIARPLILAMLASITSAGLALPGCMFAQSDDLAPAEPLHVFVGTGTGDPGEGIYPFTFDAATGTLTPKGAVTPSLNPTYLTLSPDERTLYAVNEAGRSSTISAFQVDPETGALTLLNQQPAGGAGPCYVSTDATGAWVFVAHYVSGSVAVFPVAADGRLGEAVQVVQHAGTGPNAQRQDGPHAHYIHPDPQNRFVFVNDLGIDRVLIYPFDAATGRLDTANVREVPTAPGAGPRHLDVHPNGRFVYLINELDGTVTAFAYDAAEGQMTPLQTISAMPEGFDGHRQSADIHVHPSGRFLYASNRGGFDSIAIFAIDEATGRLTFVGHEEAVVWPRNFAIDPSGAFLLVGNRRANTIGVFRIDLATGRLTLVSEAADVPEPVCITFAAR